MKRICLHGATGSIGAQTIDVILSHKDQFELLAMSFGSNVEKALEIIEQCRPKYIVSANEISANKISKAISYKAEISFGEIAIAQLSQLNEVDIVLNGIMGSSGLKATFAAIEAKKTIAIANKEPLVMAGSLVMKKAKENNVQILPVDSEHSAIFQCLQGHSKEISKIILTASGGSFRDLSRKQMENVTREQALNHPNWAMGAKITIDSATLVNKGLEVIEAHHLFQIDYDKIDVILHRESIIHSMVEYDDFSVLAHLGSSDMRIPIQYALSFPKRLPLKSEPLDLKKIGQLHFEDIRHNDFPLLKTAFDVGKVDGSAPIIFNAANEAAVSRFLASEIKFLDIEKIIFKALDLFDTSKRITTVDEVLALNKEVFEKMKQF